MPSFKDLVVETGGGNYLKIAPGTTKVRIVSEAEKIHKDFDGKKTYLTDEAAKANPDAKVRYCVYVIDRADGAVKVWEMSSGLIGDLKNLANSSEFGFDALPPYDLLINRVGSTIQDTRYSLNAARANTPLTELEIATVAAQPSLRVFLRETAEDKNEIPF